MTMENGLSFKLSVDGNTLLAVVVPCVDKIELTSEIIRQRIKITSFSDLFLNAYLISELVERYNGSTTEEFEFEIGERRDASCIISISEDEMKAHFSLTPNFGGCAMTFADVEKALENKGITFGIAPIKEIQEVLAQGICTDFLIAEGLEPVAGVDAKFLSLIPSSPARQPLINAEGSVDYRELGDILIVHKGDVLMQRIPPIEGEA
ncbi:MAG: FapA family protein, partial [Methylococcales bacterium]